MSQCSLAGLKLQGILPQGHQWGAHASKRVNCAKETPGLYKEEELNADQHRSMHDFKFELLYTTLLCCLQSVGFHFAKQGAAINTQDFSHF